MKRHTSAPMTSKYAASLAILAMRTTAFDSSSPIERIEFASVESLNDDPSASIPVTAWKAPLDHDQPGHPAHLRLAAVPVGEQQQRERKQQTNAELPRPVGEGRQGADRGGRPVRVEAKTAIIVAAADIRWHSPAATSSGPTILRVSQATAPLTPGRPAQ